MNKLKQKKKVKLPIIKVSSEKEVMVSKNRIAEEEKSFDYGGIPARDLKKNLGCG